MVTNVECFRHEKRGSIYFREMPVLRILHTDPCYFQDLSVSWAESESLINLGMFPQLNPPELRSSHHGPQTQPAFSWRILELNEDFPAMELPECHY